MAEKKKMYKLYLNKTYDERHVSRWTHRRWKKVLLAQGDLQRLKESVNSNLNCNVQSKNYQNMELEVVDNIEPFESTSNEPTVSHEAFNEIFETADSTHDNSDENIYRDILYNSDSDAPANCSDSEEESDDENLLFTDTSYSNDTFKSDTRMMFPAANLTVFDVLTMLRGFMIRFNITREMENAILQLIRSLAGPEFKSWFYSPYLLSQSISPPANKSHKYYYCDTCYVVVLKVPLANPATILVQCDKCDANISISKASTNYFISINIKFQLEMLLNRPDIQKCMKEYAKRQKIKVTSNCISDIHGSELYEKIKKDDSEALTFNFNTDGAQLFKSAKKSLWPLQLHLNELPPDIRFKHIILAGLCQTEKEPTAEFLNLFLSVFVEESTELSSTGVAVTDFETGVIKNRKVYALNASVDTVARPKLQNRIQFNGKFGGSWCYHPGKYASGSMRYPLLPEDPILRTHQEHLKDLESTKKYQKYIRGIKGESVLLKLNNFDIVWNLPPDYMHGALLGISKQLLNDWLLNYLSASDKKIIKERMENIKLCRDIRRCLRTLDYSNKYKATEWKTWLLFVSLPCLHGILPEKIFRSYSLFVDSIYTLLKETITRDEIQKCELQLLQFVGECQMLYGIAFMTFNIHSLLHYCEAVRLGGPLWCNSAFPFENGIFRFLREINAPNGCLKQISEKWLRSSIFQNYLANENDETTASKYCKSLFAVRQPLQNVTIINGTTLIGIGSSNPVVQKIMSQFSNKSTVHVEVYDRCIHKSTFFHSINYNRVLKTNDSVIRSISGDIVEIHYFVIFRKKCYICGYKWTVENNDFNDTDEPIVKHIFKLKNVMPTYITLDINSIECKAVVLDTKDNVYISFLPNTYEIQ